MASSAQYTATPKIDNAIVTTADTSRTQPLIANTGVVFTAGENGSIVDNIQMTGVGTTVASMLKLFVCKGDAGKKISGITSASTVATVTTATAHGLINGDTVTIQGCSPIEFNVKSGAITVTSTTTFTYVITNISSVAANVVGYYSSTRVATSAQYSLLREIPVIANTPAASNPVFNSFLNTYYTPEIMPIILPAGYSLRATVNDTQTGSGVNVACFGGDF